MKWSERLPPRFLVASSVLALTGLCLLPVSPAALAAPGPDRHPARHPGQGEPWRFRSPDDLLHLDRVVRGNQLVSEVVVRHGAVRLEPPDLTQLATPHLSRVQAQDAFQRNGLFAGLAVERAPTFALGAISDYDYEAPQGGVYVPVLLHRLAWLVLFHDVADPIGSTRPGATGTAPHVNIIEVLDARTGDRLVDLEDTFTPLPPTARGQRSPAGPGVRRW